MYGLRPLLFHMGGVDQTPCSLALASTTEEGFQGLVPLLPTSIGMAVSFWSMLDPRLYV